MSFKDDAKEKLDYAYEIASSNQETICVHDSFIDYVIDNNHKTYKYVLFTELLAKATDETINPLCLQKKSSLPGAYDARTICHKVIVPFEMETLDKALGGSNEPFLNKPARFPELSKTNAVRKGNDQEILNSLCDNLPLIKTSEEANNCLIYLLKKLINIREENKTLMDFSIPDDANLPTLLLHYIEQALKESFEGEILTLLVAGVYNAIYTQENATVEVHPVNQSGASRKEVSDLDIYLDNTLLVSNELKDKEYAETDVRHAADKVINSGGNKLLFITGPRAFSSSDFTTALIEEYRERNFFLEIIPHNIFFTTLIGAVSPIETNQFMHFILSAARDNKFKEETIDYLDSLAKDIFKLTR